MLRQSRMAALRRERSLQSLANGPERTFNPRNSFCGAARKSRGSLHGQRLDLRHADSVVFFQRVAEAAIWSIFLVVVSATTFN